MYYIKTKLIKQLILWNICWCKWWSRGKDEEILLFYVSQVLEISFEISNTFLYFWSWILLKTKLWMFFQNTFVKHLKIEIFEPSSSYRKITWYLASINTAIGTFLVSWDPVTNQKNKIGITNTCFIKLSQFRRQYMGV